VQDPRGKVKEQNSIPQPGCMTGLGKIQEQPTPPGEDDVLLEEFLSLVASIAMRLTGPVKQHNNSNTTDQRGVRRP